MTSDITWGPEICVDGKRPEWLGDGDALDVRWGGSDPEWFSVDSPNGAKPWHVEWNGAVAIRLPADHSHYAAKGLDNTDTLPAAPSGGEVGPEVTERMIALVRAARKLPSFTYPPGHPIGAFFDELDHLGALLPEPVDGDWEHAKQLTAEIYPDAAPQNEHALRKMAHAGLRLGRALAAGDR